MTKARWIFLIVALLVNGLLAAALLLRFSYAPVPSRGSLANSERYRLEGAYDVLGRTVDAKEARELLASEAGAQQLAPATGAVALTERLVSDGRKAFYGETFGNELFLTDVLGILDGGITAWGVGRALLGLAGRGTDDLRVRLDEDVQVGDQLFRAGTTISTGLDVPRGGWLPLGVRVFYDRGRVRAGITCAVCHATVDPGSGLVVEGAPNVNLNAGLLFALASNSAAYFLHTGVSSLDPYLGGESVAVRSSEGVYTQVPEADRFEAAVSGMLVRWPPGSFDATVDGVNDPTSIPDSFTAHDHPYGWSGFAAIGPFRGLSAINNDVHAVALDGTAFAAAMPLLGALDPEVYLAVLLQRAANPRVRFDPHGDRSPSRVLQDFDPDPDVPGLNRFVALPVFPRPNYFTTRGLVAATEDETVGYALNAMSAYQNALQAPARFALNAEGIERGRTIFQVAGCGRCHSGAGFTSHAVLPAAVLGVEPSRARALSGTEDIMGAPTLFAPDTPYPPPPDAMLLTIPLTDEERALLRLAWAHGNEGGYKVKGLVGLEWSAPYLHDGGVAVGSDSGEHVGIPGTFGRGVAPDARNSLRALFDRDLRRRVVAANAASPALVAAHVRGEGHDYWVDANAGFSATDQEALLDFLLSLREVVPQGFRGATAR